MGWRSTEGPLGGTWAWFGYCAILTILQCGGIDLAGRRPRARAVECLHHHPILRKLLEVVQCVDLAVPCGLHLHDAVLPVAAWAVLPVANLVATDHPILQLLLWGLEDKEGRMSQGWEAHRAPCPNHLSPLAFLKAFKLFSLPAFH